MRGKERRIILGYPYGDTYLEKIQKNPRECREIREAFYVLRQKYVKDHPEYTDTIEVSLQENFNILGEAFELVSDTVGGIMDPHHFMWDVLDELIPEGGKGAESAD